MDKKTLLKVALISLGIFLLGWLMTKTYFTMPANIDQLLQNDLNNFHSRLIEVETKIAEIKPQCVQLEDLRVEREELNLKIDASINSFLPKREPSKTTQTEVVVAASSSPNVSLDLNKLAKAVAWAETHDCQLGYGSMYSNCFGIKNGSIAPCAKVGNNRMCVYNAPHESYEAFYKIWQLGYGGQFPSYAAAQSWTGNDRPDTWLANVTEHYYT